LNCSTGGFPCFLSFHGKLTTMSWRDILDNSILVCIV
jgi:hypothetical protein